MHSKTGLLTILGLALGSTIGFNSPSESLLTRKRLPSAKCLGEPKPIPEFRRYKGGRSRKQRSAGK